MQIQGFFDRREGKVAVCYFGEDDQKILLPVEFLPAGAIDGDYLKMTLEKDEAATEQARQEALQLLK